MPSRRDVSALLERCPDMAESEMLQAISEGGLIIFFSKDRVASYRHLFAMQVRAYLSGYGIAAQNQGELGILFDRDQTLECDRGEIRRPTQMPALHIYSRPYHQWAGA